MIKPNKLFLNRLRYDLLESFKLVRMILDWTVLLYIVLPSVIIFLVYYIRLWDQIPINLQNITFNGVLVFTFCSFFFNDIKSYLYKADQLFLIQNKNLLKNISRYGLIYSIIITFLTSVIVILLLLPILKKHLNLDQVYIYLFYIYYISMFLSFVILKKAIKINTESILLKLIFYITSLITYVLLWGIFYKFPIMFQIVFLITLTSISFIFSKKICYNKKGFTKYVNYDDIIRNQSIKILLWQSGNAKLFNPKYKATPWILKKSKPLFKNRSVHNILTETFIKSFIRDSNNLYSVFQLTMLFISALIIIDSLWIRFILWGAAIYAITDWIKANWFSYRNNAFLRMFKWNGIDVTKAAKKSIFIFSYPLIFIVSITFGYMNFSLIGLVLCPIVSIFLITYIVKRQILL